MVSDPLFVWVRVLSDLNGRGEVPRMEMLQFITAGTVMHVYEDGITEAVPGSEDA